MNYTIVCGLLLSVHGLCAWNYTIFNKTDRRISVSYEAYVSKFIGTKAVSPQKYVLGYIDPGSSKDIALGKNDGCLHTIYVQAQGFKELVDQSSFLGRCYNKKYDVITKTDRKGKRKLDLVNHKK